VTGDASWPSPARHQHQPCQQQQQQQQQPQSTGVGTRSLLAASTCRRHAEQSMRVINSEP